MVQKTLAIQRLDAFYTNNYNTLLSIAAREVGDINAGDAVNDTYVSLLQKEERGRGHFDELHGSGSSYDTYIFSALRSTLKSYLKKSEEITESEFYSNSEDDDEGFLSRASTYENVEKNCGVLDSPMSVTAEFISVCTDCDTDIEAFVRAVRTPEKLNMSFLSKMFKPLRRAAQHNPAVISAIEDFVTIYGDNPKDVEYCLSEFGVVV